MGAQDCPIQRLGLAESPRFVVRNRTMERFLQRSFSGLHGILV
jgi:hypothetical protein